MRTAAAVVGCWMPFFDFFEEKKIIKKFPFWGDVVSLLKVNFHPPDVVASTHFSCLVRFGGL